MEQWDCIRQNLGEWHGSFTRCTPDGQEVEDISSVLKLEESHDRKTITLTLIRTPEGQPPHELTQSLVYPGSEPGVLFLDTGAFSQGSSQWFPRGRFGAELALIHGDRRLRLVQLFAGQTDGSSTLQSITVIRESRAGHGNPPSPTLTVQDLLGRWQGTATTLSPTASRPVTIPTELLIQMESYDIIRQTLSLGQGSTQQQIATTGEIRNNIIWFSQNDNPVQVILLPGGGSITAPAQINYCDGRPHPSECGAFFLEAGWLITPDHRQRLIRRYDSKGLWLDLTLVDEWRVAD